MLIIYIGLIDALGLLVLNNIELSNFDVSSLDVLLPENSSESLKVVFYSYGFTLIVLNWDLFRFYYIFGNFNTRPLHESSVLTKSPTLIKIKELPSILFLLTTFIS